MTASASTRGRVLGLGLFTLVLVAVLVGLGLWQLQRRSEKHALIAVLDTRLAAAPVPLPDPRTWASLSPARDEFRRIVLTATFAKAPQARVYASGSAIRPDVSGPGIWAFAPAHLPTGETIAVNRGFVPDLIQQGKPAEIPAPPEGVVQLTGYLRFPETAGALTPAADSGKRLWFVRDPQAMGAALGWGADGSRLAPFYVDLESPVPPGGVPKPGPLQVRLKDDHMQYAITWFGLAAVVALAFLAWLRGQMRKPA